MRIPTSNAVYWNVPGEASGAAGGEAAPPAAAPAESVAPPVPSLPQATPAGVGSTADPPGMVDETVDWVIGAFNEMQREEVQNPQPLDDVVHVDPGQTPAAVAPQPAIAQAAPQVPLQTAPPLEAPATQPVLPPTVPVAAAPPQAPQPAPVSPTPQPAPQVQTLDQSQVFDRLSTEIAKNQQALTNHLADIAYKMPAQEAEALGLTEEQASAFARKMAQVQVNVTGSVMRIMTQQMPNYVSALLQRRAQVDDGEKAFWDANPHLSKSEHEAAAIQVGTAFRQMNPRASRDEFNKFVGDFVGMQRGLVRTASRAAAPQAPQAPAVRTPGPVVRPNGHMPYQPAGVHAAPPGSLPAPQENEWSAMERIMRAFDGGVFDN